MVGYAQNMGVVGPDDEPGHDRFVLGPKPGEFGFQAIDAVEQHGLALGLGFAEFGDVSSVNILTDRETGRARGFGFVEMPNQAEAEAAVGYLNGKDLGGRTLRVNEARPRERR